jgi:hypothetical protein
MTTTFDQKTLAGMLDEEIVRAIERLREAKQNLEAELRKLEFEHIRRTHHQPKRSDT